ncbi:response regulator transcription factor [Nocardioides sp. AX2bis]|uniref:response regulator transcription factor n=1 Tax=Nocardioides sp. AX2bis TaxID=2653157 RepID=UPI0012EFC693|nr:response regulator transcription factor [Nocardioides sp. AX2bis]VXB28448.1 Transcriptional regulatory protein LiaR [Nocardioides sp. AX2bis]
MPLTIAVVNDYPLVVAGLRAVLEPYEARVLVAELDVNTPVVTPVDVVLQDTFGNADGRSPDPRRAMGWTDAKLVVFSWDTHADQVRKAMAGDVDGYVFKSVTAAELVEAVEQVHRGVRVVPVAIAPTDETAALGRWPGDEHGLSGRESEVVALICQGLSNQQISERAYLGINTIKTYIRSAYRKIGVTTRPQAVIWAMSHGFEPGREHRVLDPAPTRHQPS